MARGYGEGVPIPGMRGMLEAIGAGLLARTRCSAKWLLGGKRALADVSFGCPLTRSPSTTSLREPGPIHAL